MATTARRRAVLNELEVQRKRSLSLFVPAMSCTLGLLLAAPFILGKGAGALVASWALLFSMGASISTWLLARTATLENKKVRAELMDFSETGAQGAATRIKQLEGNPEREPQPYQLSLWKNVRDALTRRG